MARNPRILIADIETTGGLKAHMSEVEAFGYKWMGEREVKVLSCLDSKQKYYNDKPLLKELSKVWNQADAVVMHYGERFDRRFLNSRLEVRGLPPLKPITLIDTWRISKDNLALHSNSLATLLQFFHSPYQKVDLTYAEWRNAMLGHIPSLRKLNLHCKHDVLGLEYIFANHLIHYTNKLPNRATKEGECPFCGGTNLERRGYSYKRSALWRRFFCRDCRRWPEAPATGTLR